MGGNSGRKLKPVESAVRPGSGDPGTCRAQEPVHDAALHAPQPSGPGGGHSAAGPAPAPLCHWRDSGDGKFGMCRSLKLDS